MYRRNRGFTIIEVMLIATIIGTLAAIAIPTYLNYTLRAKVSEGIIMARPALLAVDEYYRTTASFPADNAQAGIPSPASYHSSILDKIEVLAGGKVTITYSSPAILNNTITYTPDTDSESLVWQCSSDLPAVYLPSSCIH